MDSWLAGYMDDCPNPGFGPPTLHQPKRIGIYIISSNNYDESTILSNICDESTISSIFKDSVP